VQAWRMRFATQLPVLLQLEALASACTEQELDSMGALACLAGRCGRYLIHRTTVVLGRST
ncbi:FHA domain-containing protein, partial [Haematococcus lacustris]